MSGVEQTLWGIHAGRLGDADSLFLKKHVIAIGWHEMGDLRTVGRHQEERPMTLDVAETAALRSAI
jgi:hypothetical protein